MTHLYFRRKLIHFPVIQITGNCGVVKLIFQLPMHCGYCLKKTHTNYRFFCLLEIKYKVLIKLELRCASDKVSIIGKNFCQWLKNVVNFSWNECPCMVVPFQCFFGHTLLLMLASLILLTKLLGIRSSCFKISRFDIPT